MMFFFVCSSQIVTRLCGLCKVVYWAGHDRRDMWLAFVLRELTEEEQSTGNHGCKSLVGRNHLVKEKESVGKVVFMYPN